MRFGFTMKNERVVRKKQYILLYFVGEPNDDLKKCIEYRACIDDYDIALRLYDRLIVRDDIVLVRLWIYDWKNLDMMRSWTNPLRDNLGI